MQYRGYYIMAAKNDPGVLIRLNGIVVGHAAGYADAQAWVDADIPKQPAK